MSSSELSTKCIVGPKGFLLHGFNVRDGGAGTVDKFIDSVAKYECKSVEFEYGWLGFLGVRIAGGALSSVLAKLGEAQDFAIAHSNGCCIVHRALQKGLKLKFAIYIAPALDADVEIPFDSVERIYVLHSTNDFPVRIAKYIPLHPWGSMGNEGAERTKQGYKNIDCSSFAAGHSDYFLKPAWNKTKRIVESIIHENYGPPVYTYGLSGRVRKSDR